MDSAAEPGLQFSDTKLARGLTAAAEAVGEVLALLDHPHTADDVLAAHHVLEGLHRRLSAAQLTTVSEIDRRALHRLDGHRSVTAHVAHSLRISPAEAGRRVATARALRDLPLVAQALADGAISVDHAQVIAQTHRNPRIRAQVPAAQDLFLAWAAAESFTAFADLTRDWARTTDLDGGFRDNERHHANRNFRFRHHGIDGSWEPTGHFGADQGARLAEIHDHYLQAEYETDWTQARAAYGEHATAADLPRTDAQRRADALERIFNDAAGAPPGTTNPPIVHNIVWTADTWFGLARQLGVDEADRLDPHWSARPTDARAERERWCDPSRYRCSTIDGTPLEPVEQFHSCLANHVRRVVITAKGVVIDLGHKARLFTGSARLAAQLQHPHCVWPGCDVPTTRCDIDHLVDHARGGPTNPANGAPLCGFHNRWKQKGFTITRHPDTGRWRTYRPDGSAIE